MKEPDIDLDLSSGHLFYSSQISECFIFCNKSILTKQERNQENVVCRMVRQNG